MPVMICSERVFHRLRSFFLGGGCDMDVGVQGEAGGEVAKHARYGLDIYTALERDGCKGVTLMLELVEQ